MVKATEAIGEIEEIEEEVLANVETDVGVGKDRKLQEIPRKAKICE